MRPYGMTPYLAREDDVAGLAEAGRPASAARFAGPGGDVRAPRSERGPGGKAATRRTIKRTARRAGKAACRDLD